MTIVRDVATHIAQSSYWVSVAALLIVPNGFRLLTKRLAVELGTAMSMSGLRLHLPARGWFDSTSVTSL
jgi:hypothetical protein